MKHRPCNDSALVHKSMCVNRPVAKTLAATFKSFIAPSLPQKRAIPCILCEMPCTDCSNCRWKRTSGHTTALGDRTCFPTTQGFNGRMHGPHNGYVTRGEIGRIRCDDRHRRQLIVQKI